MGVRTKTWTPVGLRKEQMNVHKKEQHLSFEHRVLIQTHLKDGRSPNRIAKEIGCALNTVRNEIKRGTVILHKGNILCYKAPQDKPQKQADSWKQH